MSGMFVQSPQSSTKLFPQSTVAEPYNSPHTRPSGLAVIDPRPRVSAIAKRSLGRGLPRVPPFPSDHPLPRDALSHDNLLAIFVVASSIRVVPLNRCIKPISSKPGRGQPCNTIGPCREPWIFLDGFLLVRGWSLHWG